MERPFELQVDASDVGTGDVLFQYNENGVERPVSFFSKKCNSYQLNYSVIEKEALGLVWALQHFEVYVDSGVPLVVYTDHNPITFLHSLCCLNRRLMRWFLFLQSYWLEIRHISGSKNIVAVLSSSQLSISFFSATSKLHLQVLAFREEIGGQL